jgi:hypothetical protein
LVILTLNLAIVWSLEFDAWIFLHHATALFGRCGGFLLLCNARCTVLRLTPKKPAISVTLWPLRLNSAILLFLVAILSRCWPLGSSSTHFGSGQFKHDGKNSQPSSLQSIWSGNKSSSPPIMMSLY